MKFDRPGPDDIDIKDFIKSVNPRLINDLSKAEKSANRQEYEKLRTELLKQYKDYEKKLNI